MQKRTLTAITRVTAKIRRASAFFLSTPMLILLILLLGIFFRVYQFGSVPVGVNQDEASTAYDAFAVLRYGIDRNGFHNPVVFTSWGSGMYALASYVAMPFIGLFGLSIWSSRLASLLIGLGTLFVMYGVAKEIHSKRFALTALFLLSISPWHIMISRWALDCNLFPPTFLLGVYLALVAERKPWVLPASFAAFALCLYAYGTAYMVIPLFMIGLVAFLLWRKKATWKMILLSSSVFVLIALPIALFIFINSKHLPSIILPFLSIPKLAGTPQFQNVGSNVSVFTGSFWQHALENLRYLWHILFYQNDNIIYNAYPYYGYIYVFSFPFIVLGLCIALRNTYRKKMDGLFILWLLISIAMATVLSNVNMNRMNIIILPLIYFAALGLHVLLRWKYVYAAMIIVYLYSSVGFFEEYFQNRRIEFQHSIFNAIEAVKDVPGEICITNKERSMPYIFVLFSHQTNPELFANTVVYENPGDPFQQVKSFDRYTFGLEDCRDKYISAYVLRNDELTQFKDNPAYHIEMFNDFAAVFSLLPE